jgi:Histidinol-phosphate/aromatic aminotransferase and cobyric acid decarboxylase
MIYGHGDDNYNSKETIRSNFSSNVWFGADMTELYKHLAQALPATVSYPEPNADSLVKALSKHTGVAASRITACNGSTEAFYLMALAFRSHNSLIAVPSFSEYEDACRIHSHRIHFAKQKEFEATLKRVKPDLAWICLPNNPDGFCFSRKQIDEWLSHFPKTTFIIDQAYADFTLEKTFPAKAVTKFDNLVLIHSLTKSHKIPGLRLGYVMSSRRMTDKLNSLKMPWSVNSMAIEAGKYLLEHGETNLPTAQWLVDAKTFEQQLDEIEQLEVIPSHTPFFLVKLLKGKAADLKKFLLGKGILVRDATNFRGLEGEHIRLCTQTPEENETLIQYIAEWYSQPN